MEPYHKMKRRSYVPLVTSCKFKSRLVCDPNNRFSTITQSSHHLYHDIPRLVPSNMHAPDGINCLRSQAIRDATMPKIHLSKNTNCKINWFLSILLMAMYLNPWTNGQSVNSNNTYMNMRNHNTHSIEPLILEDGSVLKPLLLEHCPSNLKIYLAAFGHEFVIDLVKNKRLISDKYIEASINGRDNLGTLINTPIKGDDFYTNNKFISLTNIRKNDDHCHYHGLVNDNVSSISAISITDSRALDGFFGDGNNTYFLHSNNDASTSITWVNFDSRTMNAHETGINGEMLRLKRSIPSKIRKRFSSSQPDNKVLHNPFQSNSQSLYVELLVVHDHKQYMEYNRNTSNIAERTMQIVNIMNAFYRQLNIFIALVGVVLWTEKDEITLTEDGDATLNNFLKYRHEKLLPRYHHDNAQLITSTSFNGSVVGKALKGPICTHDHSGGVNTDHSHVPAIVAVTLAHELGHNLGMEHDEDDKCKCPDEKCIMSSSSSSVHPKHWSSCSIDYLEDSKKHGLLECLVNKPEKVFGPICGNGFVEEGEDCDIGVSIPSYGTSKSRGKNAPSKCARGQTCSIDNTSLTNPCCDRSTCKFVGNATCAQGPCCDLAKCSVYNSTIIKTCRPKRGECDFEEVCDGKSEYCPPDVYYHDGIECGPTLSMDNQAPAIGSIAYNRSRAYCYNGLCSSHESQCQLLWGPSGSASKDICYEQNVHGNTSGNCGYNRYDKLYLGCEPDDAPCGMLHCVHNQLGSGDLRKTGKLGYGFESASILTVSFFVMSNHAKIYCHGAIIDAGPNIRDPGLVPNGAACGDDKMCFDQKCVPVYDVIYKDWCPSDCNGNGICDNRGVCHCNDGTVGTSCYQFFGANFHLTFLLYMIMFFGPIVALIALTINHYRGKIKIWWFLHNRMGALRSKAREPNQQRRLVYDASGSKVCISDPIPLNHQNNVDRPFYQPVLDPWAESSCQVTTKSPGYRLEPLNKTPAGQAVCPPPPDYPAVPRVTNDNSNQSEHSSRMDGKTSEHLRPVRSAPPPPIPPHRSSSRH